MFKPGPNVIEENCIYTIVGCAGMCPSNFPEDSTVRMTSNDNMCDIPFVPYVYAKAAHPPFHVHNHSNHPPKETHRNTFSRVHQNGSIIHNHNQIQYPSKWINHPQPQSDSISFPGRGIPAIFQPPILAADLAG